MIPPAESAGEGCCLVNQGEREALKLHLQCPHGRGDMKVKVLVTQLRPHGLYILPGFSVHEILQARTLDGQPFLSPEDLPDLGIEPRSPELQVDSLPFEPPENPTGDSLLFPSYYCRGEVEVRVPPSGSIRVRHHLITVI